MSTRRIVRRSVLDRVKRPLLARFLRTYAEAFFEEHGISLDALSASHAADRAVVQRVFHLVHAPDTLPAPPDALIAALLALDALGTSAGGEALVAFDSDGVLPRAEHGDEDLAVTALLDHPALAAAALAAVTGQENATSFTEYESRTPIALRFGADEQKGLERAMCVRLKDKGRSPYCEVHATREGSLVSLEIVSTRRPKTFDKVDTQSLTLAPSTDTHAERAFAEIDLASGRLAVHAAPMPKTLVCQSLGEVLAGDPTHFVAARIYDLSPFRRPSEVLSIAGIAGLTSAEIRALQVRTSRGTVMAFSRAREDLWGDDFAVDVIESALTLGVPVGVKVYLGIAGRDLRLKVELSVKDGKNRVDFDRSDPRVVEIVRAWMRARGILREIPAAAASAGHAEPASVRLA